METITQQNQIYIPIVEEQIPMNIKRGLKRIWIVVSVLWVVGIIVITINFVEHETQGNFYLVGVVGLFVWWGLLYVGFWISSGFSSAKKKDKKNE